MIRTFSQHEIRKQKELTGILWDFEPLEGESAGTHRTVNVPSCWESLPGFEEYRGEGVYTTWFTTAEKRSCRIECKGVSHTAQVLLDGEIIAEHYNAYTAFDAVLRDLPAGKHRLQIRADNRFNEKSALHVPNDYMSYGGISRPVILEQLGKMYVKEIIMRTSRQESGCWQASAEVMIVNLSKSVQYGKLRLEIAPAEGASACADAERAGAAAKNAGRKTALGAQGAEREFALGPNEECTLIVIFNVPDAREWSCESPFLYTVKAVIVQNGEAVDDLIDRFGFREVKVEGKKILLNGRPLRIKGVCRHEDHPQYGCALPYAAIAADLQLIRDLNCNSVRTSHYPNDEVFLDLCDEMGILVWEENHARGLSEQQMRNPNFEPQAEQVIREMIAQHYNHPSIYIWGILNECASDTEYGRACYAAQLSLIRSLDATRPCSFASCRHGSDICLDLPDVVSFNVYPEWYEKAPAPEYIAKEYDWVQTTPGAGKPFLITEIGAGGIYGWHNNYDGQWTEEFQAKALRKQLEAVLVHPDISGVYVWQFCDCRISAEWWNTRPRTMNNKGLVDEFRRRKEAYAVVKEIFGKN